MKVGIFDSGLGGLSVLHCAKHVASDIEYIFYADEENVPYGEKTPEQVMGYAKNAIDFLISKGAQAIIIACNTATSALPMSVRNSYDIPIIGMEPAIKKAVRLYGEEGHRILVAATEVTIKGDKLHNLVDIVDKKHQADMVALPGLVRYAEKGIYNDSEVVAYIRDALKSFDIERYGTIVLGCTHFNYFKQAFLDAFGEYIHFVDGNLGTVKQVLRCLKLDAEKLTADINYELKIPVDDVEIYFSGQKISDTEKTGIIKCFAQLDDMFKIN